MNAEVSVESDASITRTAPSAAADDFETTGSRRSPWRRALAWFVITIGVVALAVGASGFAYDRIHAGKILPGVEVAGVDVGGLDWAAAEAQIRAALPDITSGGLEIEVDGNSIGRIRFASLERDYDMEQMLGQALALGRDGGIVEELRTLTHGISVPVAIKWDSEALIAGVREVAAAIRADAVDARIELDRGRYVVVPSRDGLSVDEQQIYQSAAAFVSDSSVTSATVAVEPGLIAPRIGTQAAEAAIGDYERTVSMPLAITAGADTITVESDTIRGWVRLVEAGAGEWTVELEPAPISQLVAGIAADVELGPVDAALTFEQGRPVVTPATNGRELDVQASISAILDAVQGRIAGTPASTVRLAVTPVSPEFSTADAQAIASRFELLGTWTTRFTSSVSNGHGANIRRPAELIDGTVVEPGESFDFIDAAGPFTRRNGYEEGGAIIRGQTQPDGIIGGGLCSAATTLFNAVARAGLQIDARHNHSYYIGRYPVGLDATIWQNGRIRKTFAFTNDSDYPVLIRASSTRRRVTFELWGVSDGRTVRFSDARIEDEKEPKAYIRYTDELPPGVSEQVEWKATGFDAWVTRTVRDANGRVIHDDTWFSDYRRVDAIIEVGRFPDDPPAGTREEI